MSLTAEDLARASTAGGARTPPDGGEAAGASGHVWARQPLAEAAINTIEHRLKRASRSTRPNRRRLEHRARHEPSAQPRIVAVAAIVAAGIALAATLGLAPGLTAVRAERVASGHRHLARAHTVALARRARFTRNLRGGNASRLDTLPFPPNPAERTTSRGEVPSLYADGLLCSIGCRPFAAEPGWPLAPFHQQHPIRAGLNELRPASLHVGLDIQARDGAAVYAVQPGVAHVLAGSGPNARVQVGNYIYWHIRPRVQTGELVRPFATVLGTVMTGYGHIAFSELSAAGQYVNPLRPAGRVLEPYIDAGTPAIGKPAVAAGGQVIVGAYSPQTFVRRTTYVTPVLAPAALAYRLFDSSGTAIATLEWAFRGTHLLPWAWRSLLYAPGAHAPGYACFETRLVCVPHWVYRVAGGLAPPLPSTLAPGRYRLTIYVWDWADNVAALDTRVTMTATGWRAIGRFPQGLFHGPGYSSRSELLAPAWTPRGAPISPPAGLGRSTPTAPLRSTPG